MCRIVRIVVVFCAFWNGIACGQNKKKQMKNRPIAQLYKKIKKLKYTSMPQYYIEGYQSGCFYEIYINDILAFEHYENVGLANHAVVINDLILKSGLQKVTIKLFPLGKIGNEEYPVLTSKARFDLAIFKRDKATPWEGLNYDVVKEYFAPTISGESHGAFKNEGLPYFEETFTFDAEVPYELEGWNDSQNLKEIDQEVLEKEILNFYKEYADVIYNQDEEKWVKMNQKKELNYLKSVYYNDVKSDEFEARIESFKEIFDSNFTKKYPLDKYEILFSNEGRVVTLKSIENKGKSAFSYGIKVNIDGELLEVEDSEYIYLHKPKGSNKLEIIR